ncbi:hypothetical protein GYMLUDRAFT_459749 [Collybiopsis luxurians FD-317 M1]|uniref:Unplaced genomic scaffold GYMLUscaffold_152, whole genome shotgun sequence n=1 Tax=Collybiopsis luxurians FD-317 M1 TaxID=944289 RepID=A0A0D0C701_9AGAR|nr:hypothetical protein GYMLUDRAFT_459749 [Collybiopsis luxurians FD-317 M1]
MNVLLTSEYPDSMETSGEECNVKFRDQDWDSRLWDDLHAVYATLVDLSTRIPTYDVARKLDSNPCKSSRAPPLTDRRDSPRLRFSLRLRIRSQTNGCSRLERRKWI